MRFANRNYFIISCHALYLPVLYNLLTLTEQEIMCEVGYLIYLYSAAFLYPLKQSGS
jgi:hypothetical protein